jgi:hypothetical protein
MKRLDLIIENIEYAKLVTEQAHKDELLDEALAAARELRDAQWGNPKYLIEEAVLVEREACAKLCEDLADSQTNQYLLDPIDCAEAIRARSKHETT